MKRPRGYMEFSFFQNLLSELEPWSPGILLSMNMCGEPLMHKDVHKFVKEAAGRNFKTYICTNGTLCDQQMSANLIESGLNKIAFCIDGASPLSHEAYRVGSSYYQVRKNTETFLEVREKYKGTGPEVVIQTLLTSYSESELPEILNWAWNINADEVHFKTLSSGSHTSQEQKDRYAHLLPKNPLLRRKYKYDHAFCSYPADHFMVYWDGAVGLCCVDFNNEFELPSLSSYSLAELFESEQMQKTREKGCLREWDLCKVCQSAGTLFQGFRIPLKEMRKVPAFQFNPEFSKELIENCIKKAHYEA
jgi:hypothetical protein